MELTFTDTLLTIFPKESIQSIIIYGYLYFLMFFYGSEQWKGYSSFEKFVFPVIMGGAVYYLITIPISVFFGILKVFQNGGAQINPLLYNDTIFYIVLVYLVIWRFVLSNCSLKENNNNNFFNITKYLIIATISFIFIVDFVLLLAFISSDYQEFLPYVFLSFSVLILLALLYVLFLEFYGQKFVLTPSEIDDFFIDLKWKSDWIKNKIPKYKTNTKRLLFIILIFSLIVTVPIGGKHLLKTSVQLVEEKPLNRLEIPVIETWGTKNNITGDFDVEQNYSITFGLIPWVKLKPTISLDESGKSYCIDPKSSFDGEYLTINGSRWNTINVILCGKKRDNNIPKIYEINKAKLNETFQKWEIKFTNPFDSYIKIHEVILEKDRQLKFSYYEKNNMDFVEIKTDQSDIIVITQVSIWHKNRYPNQSITLFFEKK